KSTPGPAFDLIGKGYFAVLIDQGEGTTPYSGLTPIAGQSLSDCATTYFDQSEQLPTRFSLTFGRSTQPNQDESWRAGGIMLQHLAKASPLKVGLTQEQAEIALGDVEEENWTRANMLLDSVEDLELIGPHVSPTKLLYRLFHEEEPRVFEPQKVHFGCTCSPERVRKALSIYSDKDIATMTTDEGVVTADCQFCGAHYRLDPDDLGFQAAERKNGG
ncbi:MAG TPA: Hsp33 family molecular chaperone HslO, partial [Aliiroseovarius sp.]|nr:Hsp33 family molecular chaperone HslO [Aliiroseovarius sp.]